MNAVQKLLADSGLGFALCGSRLLGTHHKHSDWDYVVTASDAVVEFLVANGFKCISDEEYETEGPVLAVYRAEAFGQQLDVMVEENADFKLRIMQELKVNEDLRRLDMSLRGSRRRDELWLALYRLVGWKPAKAVPNGF